MRGGEQMEGEAGWERTKHTFHIFSLTTGSLEMYSCLLISIQEGLVLEALKNAQIQ